MHRLMRHVLFSDAFKGQVIGIAHNKTIQAGLFIVIYNKRRT